MRHCRQQRRPQRQQTRRRRWRRQTRRAGCSGVSCVVAWCRQTLGCWQRAQLPSLLPPLPLFTYDEQQSRRRRRWRTTTAAMPTAAAQLGPGAAATAASAVADTATILPHGAWWTPPGARCTRTDACSCMLHWWQDDEHSDGEGAATAATARRSSATAGSLLASLPLLPNGTVRSWHGHAKARSCEGRLRLLRQRERRHRLRGGSGV